MSPESSHPDDPRPVSTLDSSSLPTLRNHIYPTPLQPTHVRLLTLSPSTNANTPLHLTLSAHKIGETPEYEAVSYTWAADHDLPIRPVYVGEYWDVLIPGANCAAMLTSLRRPIGRILWVDAICIDQESDTEKAGQIPLMGGIYMGAMRVVVYLGGPRGSQAYPPRRDLTSLSKEGLERMLSHRYFTRLWVIQELVLAWQVVFNFDGVEWRADGRGIGKIGLSGWLGRAASGGVSEGLLGAMRVTGSSQAADVRDKVFGILGLVGQGEAYGLFPDYGLSATRVFVGLFAHLVVNLGKVADVLANAAGREAWDRWPSWVPDWNAKGGMPLERQVPDYERQWEVRTNFWKGVWELVGEAKFQKGWELNVVFNELSSYGSYPRRRPVVETGGALSLPLIRFCKIRSQLDYLGPLKHKHTPFQGAYLTEMSRLHLFFVAGVESCLLLATYDRRLEDQVQPGDEIFYICEGDLPLVMRRHDGNMDDRFRIVGSLHSVCLVLRKSNNSHPSGLDINPLARLHVFRSLEKSFPRLSEDGELVDSFLEEVYPELARFRDSQAGLVLRRQIFPGVTTAKQTLAAIANIVRTYRGYRRSDIKNLDPNPFLKQYDRLNRQFLRDKLAISRPANHLGPFEQPDYFQLCFPEEYKAYVHDWYLSPVDLGETGRRAVPNGLDLPVWEWKKGDRTGHSWVAIDQNNLDLKREMGLEFGRYRAVHLRSRYVDIMRWLRDCWWETEVLGRLAIIRDESDPKDLLTELDLLRDGKDETISQFRDRFQQPKSWPKFDLTEHDIDGEPRWVTIV